MSIVIKGMKMPKNCYLCHFVFRSKVNKRVFCTAKEPIFDISETLAKNRADDCPLVELPPHGRLIDADVLKELYDLGEELDYCHVKLPVIRLNIDDMPTILEAEGGE